MGDQSFVPTVTQLRVFVAVAERLHFRMAAADLGLSQPSLSQALSTLEEGLGVKLIERSTRSVLITPVGMRLLGPALDAIEACEAVVNAASGSGGPLAGALRIGVIPTAAPYLLPGLLPVLTQRFPGMQPRIIEDQTSRLLDGLRAGSVDLALLALPTEAVGVVEIPLYREAFSLIVPASHALAGAEGLPLSVLAEVPLLLLDEGNCLRDQTLDLCRQVSAPVLGRSDTRATSLATAVQCVAGGLGVSLVPESAVKAETRDPALSVARFADPQPGRVMGLVMRSASAHESEYQILGNTIREVAVPYCGAVPLDVACSE